MICLHTKFHVPSPDGSLVFALKSKTKCWCNAAALFYILQKNFPRKAFSFQIYYHTSFHCSKLNGANITSILQVCAHHTGIADCRK
jgi:hypothetical protein